MHEINDASKLDRVDLNLFRVFATVYRERNLTHAAAILCLSQSAVSHAIGRLRLSLNDPLFVREGQGVVPTPLADRLWPDIHDALALFRQAVVRQHNFEPARDVTQLTLAMNDKLEPSILPRVARTFQTTLPHLQLASIRLDRPNLRTDLVSGRIDFAIDVAQATPSDIGHVLLLKDEFAVVCRESRVLDEATYLAARHITVSSRRTGHSMEDIGLSRLGIERQVVMRCQYYEAACRLVAESDLLLTMPMQQAVAINATLGNAIVPLPVSLPSVELHLYWNRQREEDPANQWLRREFIDMFAES